MRRQIESHQLKVRYLMGYFDGTVATPSPDGFDKHQYTITKVGTGEYTIIMNEGSEKDVHPVSFLSDLATVENFQVTAVDTDRVTVKAIDSADAAIDTKVWFTLALSDNPDFF